MSFSPTKRKKIRSHLSAPEQLRLTSLIDLFTIIIVFLLKSYSAVEVNVVSRPDLTLPTTVMVRAPEESTVITVAKGSILVDGNYVAEVTPSGDVVGLAPDDVVIPGLLGALRDEAAKGKDLAFRNKEQFKGEITLQGDKDVPYKLLKRVLITAGKAEFGQFRLAAYREEK